MDGMHSLINNDLIYKKVVTNFINFVGKPLSLVFLDLLVALSVISVVLLCKSVPLEGI